MGRGRNRYSPRLRKETITGAQSPGATMLNYGDVPLRNNRVGQVISINRETVEPASMGIVKQS